MCATKVDKEVNTSYVPSDSDPRAAVATARKPDFDAAPQLGSGESPKNCRKKSVVLVLNELSDYNRISTETDVFVLESQTIRIVVNN